MSSNTFSHIKQLTEVTEELRKFTVEDFEKTEQIIKLLEKYNKWSLLWNGYDFLNSDDLIEMLRQCIWYAKKNDLDEF